MYMVFIFPAKEIRAMKKIIAVLVIAAMAVSFASALDMSAGGGVSFSGLSSKTEWSMGSFSDDGKLTATYFGFNGFFDAQYAVASVGLQMSLSQKADGEDTKEDTTDLTMGILGKYPIALGSFTVFPLAGIEYDANLSIKADGEKVDKADLDADVKASYNMFWIKAGIGADFGINDNIYIRPTALFGYKLKSKLEKDYITDMKDAGGEASINTFKYDIGLSVGYKF